MTNKKHRKNGEGTLFKRKDGRWQASFIASSDSKRKYVYGKTQGEALEKLRTAQQEDKQGTLATGPNQKLGEYLVQWLENVYRPSVRISSYVNYRSVVNHHLIPGLGNIYLQKLTPQHIQAFYGKKSREGLKPNSIALIHAALHKALDNAMKWNLISRNVASLVSTPRIERYEVHPLSFDDAQKLLDAARGDKIETMLIVAITTGMRRGELLGLRWSDIDLQQGILHVKRTMNRYAGFGIVENDPKTKSSRRRILLPDEVIVSLFKHRDLQDKAREQLGERWKERNLVFTNTTGDFWEPQDILVHFDKLVASAGLPHMRFHDLRHSAATILLVMGVHPKIVQELLGHSSISITMDTYSHLLPSMQKDAVEKLNTAFRDRDKKPNLEAEKEEKNEN